MSKGSFIDDLRDIPALNNFDAPSANPHKAIAKEDAREKFPCESCRGTGIYQNPRVHQEKSHCFACKGKGFFYKSYADRMASKARRVARKERVVNDSLASFDTKFPGLLADMRKHASWNEFLRKLVGDIDAGKALSEKAIAAAQNTIAKANARDDERAAGNARRLEGASVVNAGAIKDAFDKASANGLKRPVLRYEGFQVSRAPDHGKNAGALYVKDSVNDMYLGKIVGDKYIATSDAERHGYVAKVVEAMTNPLELAIAYGRRTGACSCCGRKLSDPVSVDNGIGPVCATNFGW